MKKYLYSSIAGMITFYGCAQSPVIDRFGSESLGMVENAYYKDVNGFLNQYVGTWIYSNGNKMFKVVFAKKPMMYVSSFKNYYEDYLAGEFQYIENGVEKVNTLANLSNSYSNIRDYNLYSVAMMKKDSYPLCPECGENEKRLLMFFNEPSRRNIWNGIGNNFVIRKFVENGQEKLKVQFVYTGHGLETLNTMDGPSTNINSFSVPYGEYILVKQP
ncbi:MULTISPECIES: DUF6705 family protein [unclassified Flavobacterium]|uniref:DUF6705 family protein n=1 Tax=unclassified Flavobacterium TaxID=196869 RepID=UPI0009646D90|nr:MULTISPECIES: DUF6705 family protein [unclassified Flavobacterium]MBN9285192.1 hypothetical protein [Flavobacterium sp.]OJV72087.1 MAG: hypothetical protein BGO42_01620 [Flavobacterium sp. 40-81]